MRAKAPADALLSKEVACEVISILTPSSVPLHHAISLLQERETHTRGSIDEFVTFGVSKRTRGISPTISEINEVEHLMRPLAAGATEKRPNGKGQPILTFVRRERERERERE